MKPIAQKTTEAGIPIVPVQTWFESTTRRDGHPDQQPDTLANAANFIAIVDTTVVNVGMIRQLRTGELCNAYHAHFQQVIKTYSDAQVTPNPHDSPWAASSELDISQATVQSPDNEQTSSYTSLPYARSS